MGFLWKLVPEPLRAVAVAAIAASVAFAAGGAIGYLKGRADASNKAEVSRLNAEIEGLKTSLFIAQGVAKTNELAAAERQKEATEAAKIIEEIRNAPHSKDDACRSSDDDFERLRRIGR